jgi:hypothetical protein
MITRFCFATFFRAINDRPYIDVCAFLVTRKVIVLFSSIGMLFAFWQKAIY